MTDLTKSQADHLRRAMDEGTLDLLSPHVRSTTVRHLVKRGLLESATTAMGMMARFYKVTNEGRSSLAKYERHVKAA